MAVPLNSLRLIICYMHIYIKLHLNSCSVRPCFTLCPFLLQECPPYIIYFALLLPILWGSTFVARFWRSYRCLVLALLFHVQVGGTGLTRYEVYERTTCANVFEGLHKQCLCCTFQSASQPPYILRTAVLGSSYRECVWLLYSVTSPHFHTTAQHPLLCQGKGACNAHKCDTSRNFAARAEITGHGLCAHIHRQKKKKKENITRMTVSKKENVPFLQQPAHIDSRWKYPSSM